MKKGNNYSGSWLDFRTELEKVLTENIIDNNYGFFRECFSWGVTPNRAINYYL